MSKILIVSSWESLLVLVRKGRVPVPVTTYARLSGLHRNTIYARAELHPADFCRFDGLLCVLVDLGNWPVGKSKPKVFNGTRQ